MERVEFHNDGPAHVIANCLVRTSDYATETSLIFSKIGVAF